MRVKLYSFLILLGSLAWVSCGQKQAAPQTAPQELPTISAQALSDRIADGRETFVLDVRTPREYDGPLGHIAGSRLIPVQELSRRMEELSGVKDRHIFVICRSGNRSATATRMLREGGFEASNVAGGMQAWKSLAEKN